MAMAPEMRTKTPSTPTFATLFDELRSDSEAEDHAPRRRPGLTIDGLEAAWEMAGPTPANPVNDSKFGWDAADVAPSGDAAADAETLLVRMGLQGCTTETELYALRREFALRNHPDRLPPGMRTLANERMTAVNAIIDRQIARLRRGGASQNRKVPDR